MSGPASLLLDVGGQSVFGQVLNARAKCCCQTRRKISTCETNERVEQDPDEIVAAVQAVMEAALGKVEQSGGPTVTQAALAVQRGSIVCWDRKTGAALSPVLSWRDRRSLPGLAHLAEQAEDIRRRTGLRFSPYAGAPKLAWCLSELPEVQSAAKSRRLVCGPLGSFLLARLLENKPARVDHTLAQRSLLWSRASFSWDPWLLDRFGLPADTLPDLVPGRSPHGRLKTRRQTLELNLLIGDQNSLPFIDGRPGIDTLYVNLGTGAFLLRPVTRPTFEEPRFQTTLLGDGDEKLWALEASVHGAASALNWLKRKHDVDLPHEQWHRLRQNVSDPPLFLNTIDGLGSPWWRPGPQPAFVAADEGATPRPEALLLAVLESIAFLIRANVDAMAETTDRPRRVLICGGLSQSDTVCRLVADLLGTDVQRLRAVEGTALGLWSRLHNQAPTSNAFDRVRFEDAPALRQRYRQWLKHMDTD